MDFFTLTVDLPHHGPPLAAGAQLCGFRLLLQGLDGAGAGEDLLYGGHLRLQLLWWALAIWNGL